MAHSPAKSINPFYYTPIHLNSDSVRFRPQESESRFLGRKRTNEKIRTVSLFLTDALGTQTLVCEYQINIWEALKTLPKAQRTRGLSSYHKFLH